MHGNSSLRMHIRLSSLSANVAVLRRERSTLFLLAAILFFLFPLVRRRRTSEQLRVN